MNKAKTKVRDRSHRAYSDFEYPLFCDFNCAYADFGSPDVVGACRRDVGVWCKKAKRYHAKHARCLFHEDIKERK